MTATCNGCSGTWRVITRTAIMTPMSISNKSAAAIINTIVKILVMAWQTSRVDR